MGTPHYHHCTGDCPDGLTAGGVIASAVGICGAVADPVGIMRGAVCELPAFHPGWHRDGGMSWTARPEPVPTREEHTEENR